MPLGFFLLVPREAVVSKEVETNGSEKEKRRRPTEDARPMLHWGGTG